MRWGVEGRDIAFGVLPTYRARGVELSEGEFDVSPECSRATPREDRFLLSF